ncbi:hypothetical protein VTO73DRAFT_13955 [Trametes versicolor]
MPSTPGAVARTVRPCAKANTYPIIIPGDICDGCLLLLRGPLILSPSRSLTSRSLAIDRLKSTLLNVPLGKEPLLEAEVELKLATALDNLAVESMGVHAHRSAPNMQYGRVRPGVLRCDVLHNVSMSVFC